MRGEATPAQIGGFLVALRAQGRDGRRDRRLRRGDARARAARPPAARRPRRHGRHGRRRRAHAQHLDRGRDRRGGGRRRRSRSTATAPSRRRRARRTCSRRSASRSSCRRSGSRARSTSSASASCSRRSHHPAMRHAAPVRRELATRTVFNVLGPLTNPAGARAQVVGVYAPALVRTIAEVLAQLGARRAFVVHGAGGIDELSPAGPNLVCEVVDGDGAERELDPLELGIPRCDPAELRGGDPATNARGAPRRPRRRRRRPTRRVLLNAAGAIAAAGPRGRPARGARARARGGRLRRGRGAARRARGVLACGSATRSPRPAWARSPRSSAARRRPATSAPDADPAAIAAGYERAGAAAISVLVDERFGGTWTTCAPRAPARRCRCSPRASSRREEHLRTAQEAGADAVLLLLRDLDDAATARADAHRGRARARHARRGARRRRSSSARSRCGAPVIGVNARDLSTFEIDRATQLELVARDPAPTGSSSPRAGSAPRAGRRRRARRRRRDPRRLGADAGARPGGEARASCSRARSSRSAA